MLMKLTFWDPSVFNRCSALPVPLLRTIQQELPTWILEHYRWGFKFTSSLSTAYILPKPSRDFQKARPIVDYSNAWCRTLGSSLATALHEILQVVYSELLQITDIRSALQSVAHLFSCQDYTYGDLLLLQEDIAGIITKLIMIACFKLFLLQFVGSVNFKARIQLHL
jgi:hypothetical protein